MPMQPLYAGLIMKAQFKLELPPLQPEDTDAVNLSPIASPSPRFEYRDAPIQLIEYFPDTGSKSHPEFQVNPEAMELLASVPAPLAVVAVAGLYRTGKSYLLNRIILDRKSGFGVGPSVNPCTKGLWVWGRPIEGRTIDGENCSVLVADSEGVGALDGDEDHDARIFALAMLISSFFLYNSTGAIDESALQSVSFIANITKHIHIRSSEEAPEAADFSAYFPKFLWVVRDFTLQLTRQEGGTCTPKDYLELALEQQKGSSEQIEERNKVRTALKSFFKDRDCFTLVRPVANEAELQRLDGKELSDLRPEFVQQVYTLRRKVLQGVTIKRLNGRAMTGEMLAGLLHTYTQAINEGVVPSIESAWTYISAGACEKAFHEALDTYNEAVTRGIDGNFPLLEQELKEIHRTAKTDALEIFEAKAFGDEKESYGRQLRVKLAQTIAKLRTQNEELGQKQALDFLEATYLSISSRVKSGELPSVIEYEKELRAFQQYFLQHGPSGPMRNELLYQFCLGRYCSAADLFIKRVANELAVSGQIHEEQISHLTAEVKENKENSAREIEALQRKLYASDADKTELQAKALLFEQQIKDLRIDRDRTERELRDSLKAARLESNKQIEALITQKAGLEDAMKELESRLRLGDSEIEQERALHKQKVEFLEKAHEEAEKRENEAQMELSALRKDHSTALRDLQNRLEQQLKQTSQQYEASLEHVSELENQLALRDTELQKVQIKWEQETKSLGDMLAESKRQANEARSQLDRKENESITKMKEISEGSEGLQSKMKEKLEDFERKARQAEEELQVFRLEALKDRSVQEQKVSFLTEQLEEAKKQLESERKRHETLFAALQTTESLPESCSEGELQALQDKHKAELRSIELSYEEMRKSLITQLEDLKSRNNDLELQLRLEASEREARDKSTSDKLISLADDRTRLTEELKTVRAAKLALAEEEENRYRAAIKALERAQEELKSKAIADLEEANSQSAAALEELRTISLQKEQHLQDRAEREKSKAEKRFNDMVEEYENKRREDDLMQQERIEEMETQITILQTNFQEQIAEISQKYALEQQKVDTLERHLKDTKDSLNSIHSANAGSLQIYLDNFAKERTALLEKIEHLNSELQKKDRESSSLMYKSEYLEKAGGSKDKELEDLRGEFAREKKILMESLDDARKKNRQLADDVIVMKSSYKQELALANQHIEFQGKKIGDLEKKTQELMRSNTDNMRSVRDEVETELADRVNQLALERDVLKRDVESRQREVREVESSCAKQLAAVEREKSVLAEKLAAFEGRRVEGEAKLRQELAQLQAQLKEKRDIEGPDKLTLQSENERLRAFASELEKDLAEKKNLLERDRLLYENKFVFLTQQKETAKAELNEAQRKFELTLEEIKRRNVADKDKAENTTASLLASVENRYNMQIKELKETQAGKNKELEDIKTAADAKIKMLKETLEIERKSRHNDSGSLERRVGELTEAEQRLSAELEILRKDRDRRTSELQAALDQEKEQFRPRLLDLERRAKEAEHQRGQMYLEHEKERAKWALERDHLVAQRNEAQDGVERLEKRKEALLREIEKLRADRNAKGRIMNMVARARPPLSVLGSSSILEEEDPNQYPPPEVNTTPNTSSSDVSPLHSRKRSFNGPRAMSPLNRRETPTRTDSARTRYDK